MSIPPTAPAIPPKPTTEPTAWRGKHVGREREEIGRPALMRGGREADEARPPPTDPSCADANTIGMTASAQVSIAVLRARSRVQPRLISDDDSQPPPMLPTSAIR